MQPTLFAYPTRLMKGKDGRYLARFPDIPEALTDGATREEALQEAADALSEALMARIADKEDISKPSSPKRGQVLVSADPTVALKVALYIATREQRLSTAALARKLGVDHKEARRLLDPHHVSKLPRLRQALASTGYEVVIGVRKAGTAAPLLMADQISGRAKKVVAEKVVSKGDVKKATVPHKVPLSKKGNIVHKMAGSRRRASK